MKKALALILALITVLSLFSCKKKEEGELMGVNDPFSSEEIVMKSENFSFSRGEFSVLFYNLCNEQFSSPENIDFYNVDPSVSLKEQMMDESTSWFTYFTDIAKANMKETLILCEAAKANGIVLSDEDVATVEDAVDEVIQYAIDMAYDKDEYFKLRYGPDASENALREYLKKEALAARYADTLIDSFGTTEEDLSKFASQHSEDFETISYLTYTFDEDKDENAKAAAEALAKITDPAAFESSIIDYMTNTLQLRSEEITTDSCYKNQKYYDKYSEFSKHAFDEDAPVGTTYVKENAVDGQYTVYLLTKAAGVRDDNTKNVRVVLIDINRHETPTMAKTYAEELLAGWKSGEATEETFIQLVKDKTEEKEAVSVEGLIEGICAGDSLPDGMEAWLYNTEIAKGDTKIFLDSGSYFIVYYCGEGEPTWKMHAKNGILNTNYDSYFAELEKKYKVESFDNVFASLEA